jgi:hypothetical protein
MATQRSEAPILGLKCKAAVDAWPEPTLLFQAILYLRRDL